jgi:hypothetical protein
MLYKFAQQLHTKLIDQKCNEIVDTLLDLNNVLVDKSDVHQLEEHYKIKNMGLIKQIRKHIRIYCHGFRAR